MHTFLRMREFNSWAGVNTCHVSYHEVIIALTEIHYVYKKHNRGSSQYACGGSNSGLTIMLADNKVSTRDPPLIGGWWQSHVPCDPASRTIPVPHRVNP